jgi:hypothetical protein
VRRNVVVLFDQNGVSKQARFFGAYWRWSNGLGALKVYSRDTGDIIGHFRTLIVEGVYYAD